MFWCCVAKFSTIYSEYAAFFYLVFFFFGYFFFFLPDRILQKQQKTPWQKEQKTPWQKERYMGFKLTCCMVFFVVFYFFFFWFSSQNLLILFSVCFLSFFLGALNGLQPFLFWASCSNQVAVYMYAIYKYVCMCILDTLYIVYNSYI